MNPILGVGFWARYGLVRYSVLEWLCNCVAEALNWLSDWSDLGTGSPKVWTDLVTGVTEGLEILTDLVSWSDCITVCLKVLAGLVTGVTEGLEIWTDLVSWNDWVTEGLKTWNWLSV